MTSSTRILLAAIVISGVTTFMFYPLITLALLDRGQSPINVGLILGLLSGVGPIASVFIGHLNASWGSKKLSISGLLLRSIGLSVFIFDSSVWLYAIGAIFASLASGSVALALKTELMRSSTSRQMITLRAIMVNIGALLGPSLGGLLFFYSDFATVISVAILSYILIAFILVFVTFQPAENTQKPPSDMASMMIYRHINKSVMLLGVSVLGYWTIYAFWPLLVPILALKGIGTAMAAGWIYSGNAVLILALQYWLIVKSLARVRSTNLLISGFILFMTGFLCLFLPLSPVIVILFAILFSLAEMLVSPTLDEITGKLDTGPLGLTQTYGLMGTISGIGSLIGAPISGFLIEVGGNLTATLWFIVPMTIISLLAGFFLKKRETFT